MYSRKNQAICWDIYPVERETQGWNSNGTVLVDMSGDLGRMSAAFKQRFPSVPGKVVLQDLEGPISVALSTPGVQNMVHDIFTTQPIKGMPRPSFTQSPFPQISPPSSPETPLPVLSPPSRPCRRQILLPPRHPPPLARLPMPPDPRQHHSRHVLRLAHPDRRSGPPGHPRALAIDQQRPDLDGVDGKSGAHAHAVGRVVGFGGLGD